MIAALLLLLLQQTPAERAREVVDLLLAEKYAEVAARFNAEMKKALPPDKLAEGSARFKSFGAVKEILKPEVAKAGTNDVVVVPVIFEKFGANIQVTIDQNGEVMPVRLRSERRSSVTCSSRLRSCRRSAKSARSHPGYGGRQTGRPSQRPMFGRM